MSVAEVKALSNLDALEREKEGQHSLDNIIRQEIGKEPFLSFSRADGGPFQWAQLLQKMDQHGSSKNLNDLKVENLVGSKEHSLNLWNGESTGGNEVKEPDHPLKDDVTTTKGAKNTSEELQTLKISEAVTAFAQALSRPNGEPKKYLPGWPLFLPSKVQLQKCKKCSREFCSAINYRRHARLHRRSLNEKDSPRSRESLGAFWDKLSLDVVKEIVSLDNVAIQEVAGYSITRALSSWIRNQGFSSLPHTYVKAGIDLLDVVHARSSNHPISSLELFRMLDDASENTFLCSGTAVSLQKFVFDREVAKIALEMKNLVACLSFFLEQKLVKAWLADKDAEALRCHKLLMEEEEAAQRRQAELLERRMKKLRQRAQKRKDLAGQNNSDMSPVTPEDRSDPSCIPDAIVSTSSDLQQPEATERKDPLFLEPTGSDPDVEQEQRFHLHTVETVPSTDHPEMQVESDGPQPVAAEHLPFTTARTGQNGNSSRQIPAAKAFITTKHSNKDTKPGKSATGLKVWTRKTKADNWEQVLQEGDEKEKSDSTGSSKVLVGSISVTLGRINGHCKEFISAEATSLYRKRLIKHDVRLKDYNPLSGKQWIPLRRLDGTAANVTDKESQMDESSKKIANHITPDEEGLPSCGTRVNGMDPCKNPLRTHATADLRRSFLFSHETVDNLLAQRWKEVIATEHVKLLLIPEAEASDCQVVPEANSAESRPSLLVALQ